MPLVSVIIPFHRLDARLDRCLRSLDGLRAPPGGHEIILVADGVDPGDLLERFPFGAVPARTLGTPGVGPARARNQGVAAAGGRLLAFTDSDCVVDPDWLVELTVGLPDVGADDLAGVGGPQRAVDEDTAFGRRVQVFFEAIFFVGGYVHRSDTPRDVAHTPSCNACYRRSAFERVGGFDPGLWPGEDLDLDLRLRRAGVRLRWNPRAIVGHHRPATPTAFARVMERYGRFSGGLLTRRYGVFRWLCLEPLLALAACVLLGMAPRVGLAAIAIFVGAFAAYFVVRTRSGFGAASCLGLLVLTGVAWNVGFARGFLWTSPGVRPSEPGRDRP